jgi:hypothetical protein
MIVLSEAAIASDWVEDEVDKAFEKERQRGGIVLFPVRLLARLLRDLRIDAAGVAAKKRPPTTSGPVATAIPLILRVRDLVRSRANRLPQRTVESSEVRALGRELLSDREDRSWGLSLAYCCAWPVGDDGRDM